MKLTVSKLVIGWKAFIGLINPFGTMAGSIADYVLEVLKNCIGSLSDGTKTKIQSALNTAQKVLAILVAIKWLVPTKWQTAYAATIAEVTVVVDALTDLDLTKDELTKIVDGYNAAYKAWMSPDDETCVE